MTVPVTARAYRAALRRAQRGHRSGNLGDFLTDVYLAALLIVMYGWAAADTIADYAGPSRAADPAIGPRYWLIIGAGTAVAGLALRALTAVGPLFATPAAQTWALSTPISRAGWLWSRLVLLLGLAGGAGALTAAALGAAAGLRTIGLATLSGALIGFALAAVAVTMQPATARQLGRALSTAATALGMAVCGAVLALRAAGQPVPRPALPLVVIVGVGAACAVIAGRQAARALGRIDRAALNAGSAIAAAAVGSATLLDPTLLSGVIAQRRWRRIGTVRSRPWLAGARWWLLVQAECRRVLRRPGVLVAWAVLLLVPHGVALIAPSIVGPVRIIAGYLAVERLAGGLRAVCRSPALRRILGGTDPELKLAHLIVPAIGLSAWWAVTAPVARSAPPPITLVLGAGILAAVYRAASRTPVSYAGTAVDTPFGLLPLDVLHQLFKGPDVLAVVLLVNAVAGG